MQLLNTLMLLSAFATQEANQHESEDYPQEDDVERAENHYKILSLKPELIESFVHGFELFLVEVK